MEELGINEKLSRLVKITLNKIQNMAVIREITSRRFEVKNGLNNPFEYHTRMHNQGK